MDPRTDAELLMILSAFTLRARRIEAHSLMTDETSLEFLAASGRILTRENGVTSISQPLPNEEALEALAARVRPLILKGDPVHYERVLKALRAYLARHDTPLHSDWSHAAWAKQMQKTFRDVDPAQSNVKYFLSMSTEGEQSSSSTDAELALSWFYGDLVHADQEKVEAGSAFGILQRFMAAATRVAQLALLARDTLSYIRFLVAEEVLPPSALSPNEVAVTVSSKELELTGVHVGEEGATLEPGADPLAAGFKDITTLGGQSDGSWQMRVPWGDDA